MNRNVKANATAMLVNVNEVDVITSAKGTRIRFGQRTIRSLTTADLAALGFAPRGRALVITSDRTGNRTEQTWTR